MRPYETAVLGGFFHFNITVRDMERSLAFYRSLGFEVREDVQPRGNDIAPHLGMRIGALRAVILALPSDPGGPVLDLVQYLDPPTAGAPYAQLNHVGIARAAFEVDEFDAALAQLQALEAVFFGPPVSYAGPGGQMLRTVMFRDPDGTALQIIGKA